MATLAWLAYHVSKARASCSRATLPARWAAASTTSQPPAVVIHRFHALSRGRLAMRERSASTRARRSSRSASQCIQLTSARRSPPCRQPASARRRRLARTHSSPHARNALLSAPCRHRNTAFGMQSGNATAAVHVRSALRALEPWSATAASDMMACRRRRSAARVAQKLQPRLAVRWRKAATPRRRVALPAERRKAAAAHDRKATLCFEPPSTPTAMRILARRAAASERAAAHELKPRTRRAF
mmetsp:Transcript_10327/g.30803  ORF Transcript_10327/g.30803 Transcript_10327/m.30803 type:complete len:243 (-) Transcript_10327:1117-1845(-)